MSVLCTSRVFMRRFSAWDDDFAVITSQNWLSADPGHNSPLQEVGVFLKGARIADNVITAFLNARRY